MKRHDILKALRRIRKALFPGERYELIIHTPDGTIVKYVGRKVSVTHERKNVDELANQIKNRMLSAKFIPEKNSSVSKGDSR